MSGLDPLIHAPARLRLCAMLAAVDQAQFAAMRDRLEVSDSALSKHVSGLAKVSYVKVRKGTADGRRTTWISLTSNGRRAFDAHVAALRAVLDDVETPT